MVMTAEEKKAKRKVAYQKRKAKMTKEKMSATMIQKAVKAYLAKPKPKPKKKRKPPTKETRGEIKKSMEAYHSCCKSHKCGKKYNK